MSLRAEFAWRRCEWEFVVPYSTSTDSGYLRFGIVCPTIHPPELCGTKSDDDIAAPCLFCETSMIESDAEGKLSLSMYLGTNVGKTFTKASAPTNYLAPYE